MREITILIKRDLILMRRIYWKKSLIFFGLTSLFDILIVFADKKDIFIENIMGMTQEHFLGNPLLLPYGWLFLLFGLLVVFYDFLSFDLFEGTQHIMTKVKKRTSLWFSKIITGGIAAIVIGMFQFLIHVVANQWLHLNINVLGKASIVTIFSMWTIYVCYQLLVLYLNYIIAFIVMSIWVVGGLSTNSPLALVNSMMLLRNSMTACVKGCGIIIIFCIIVGAVSINRIDLLEREEKNNG
ncbi:MAG: hypothetical protein PHD70_02985 [Anaerostipes sp.]|jgi:hypothetical protein|nr:hypothetical protein [Anaerostipes sp.]